MATKEELETELAELKTQLAEIQAKKSAGETEGTSEVIAESAVPEEALSEDAPKDELQKLVEQLTGMLEDHPTTKTLLLVLGVFGAGYLLGRSR